MTTLWLAAAAVVAVAVTWALVPIAVNVILRYRRKRIVRCPETGLLAEVGIDARGTAFPNVPLRVVDCSLWPARRDCEQRCLAEGQVA